MSARTNLPLAAFVRGAVQQCLRLVVLLSCGMAFAAAPDPASMMMTHPVSHTKHSDQPYLSGTDTCEVVVNPAFWERADIVAAVREADQASRQIVVMNAPTTKAASSSPPAPIAVRTDAAGNVLVRVGFVATPMVVRARSLAQLEVAANAALKGMSTVFQRSGVAVAFELAAVQAYGGDAREQVEGDSMRTLWTRLTTPWSDGEKDPNVIPGNYAATVSHRKLMNANILVLLVPLNMNQGAGGTAFIGSGRYGGRPWMMMTTDTTAAVANGQEIDPLILTHEVGHLMGQRHGVETDYIANERDYRLTVNHPFAMGFRSPQPYGGLSTMMAYTTADRTAVPRFSDPRAVQAVGTQQLTLGKADRADSVRALNIDLRSFALGTIPDLEPWPVAVVEYYHAGLNQYYMTAAAENIATLDRLGVEATGWARTGQTLKAISTWGEPPDTGLAWLQPPLARSELDRFYRFYGSPEGLNSHFYGGTSDTRSRAGWGCTVSTFEDIVPPDAVEMLRALQADRPGDAMTLHFEGIDFRGPLVRYQCDIPSLQIKRFVPICDAPYRGTGTTLGTPVYRLYNNEQGTRTRADGSRIQGNHRYTKDPQIRETMLSQGWLDEGIAWCEPRIVGVVAP